MPKFITDTWPVLSFGINAVLAIVGFLAIRWLGGIVKSFEQSLRIAILELKEELRQTYATADDLDEARQDLRREIDMAGRLDEGFASVAKLIVRRTPGVT
jgi:hypothetical protein